MRHTCSMPTREPLFPHASCIHEVFRTRDASQFTRDVRPQNNCRLVFGSGVNMKNRSERETHRGSHIHPAFVNSENLFFPRFPIELAFCSRCDISPHLPQKVHICTLANSISPLARQDTVSLPIIDTVYRI